MLYWKSLEIYKKHRGILLCVYAKNGVRVEILEANHGIYIGKFPWKFILTQFLSDLAGHLPFDTALENNTVFLKQFFGFGSRFPILLCGLHTFPV